MAIGDQDDIFLRLKRSIPNWFGNDSPVLDAVLKGTAKTDSYIYDLIQYANKQTRIETATGIYLDYISQDFFGDTLPRRPTENDSSFRKRIQAFLLAEKATRLGIFNLIKDLTGIPPVMIEGWNVGDVGCYDSTLYYDQGYGLGDLTPYTGLIYVFMPEPTGFGNIYGFDEGLWGYDFNTYNAYIDLSQEITTVTEQDILDLIEKSKVFGTKIYVHFIYEGVTP